MFINLNFKSISLYKFKIYLIIIIDTKNIYYNIFVTYLMIGDIDIINITDIYEVING